MKLTRQSKLSTKRDSDDYLFDDEPDNVFNFTTYKKVKERWLNLKERRLFQNLVASFRKNIGISIGDPSVRKNSFFGGRTKAANKRKKLLNDFKVSLKRELDVDTFLLGTAESFLLYGENGDPYDPSIIYDPLDQPGGTFIINTGHPVQMTIRPGASQKDVLDSLKGLWPMIELASRVASPKRYGTKRLKMRHKRKRDDQLEQLRANKVITSGGDVDFGRAREYLRSKGIVLTSTLRPAVEKAFKEIDIELPRGWAARKAVITTRRRKIS